MAYESNYAKVNAMTTCKVILAWSIMSLVWGCQSMAANDDVAARIDPPTIESRLELQRLVNEVLRTQVILAEDALTHSSVLTIERNPALGIQRPAAQGRNMDTPIQFRLMLNNSACILVDQRDGARYALKETTCVPEQL